MTAVLMVVSGATVFLLSTAGEAFHLLLSIGAGTGLIYLLRWFWWRINAWSEIAAMASSFIIALSLFVARKVGLDMSSHAALVWSVALTTVVWVVVTFLDHRPTPRPCAASTQGPPRGPRLGEDRRPDEMPRAHATVSRWPSSAGSSAAPSSTRDSSGPGRCSTAIHCRAPCVLPSRRPQVSDWLGWYP